MEKLNITTIAKRVKSETPVFWKKIRALMLSIGGVGLAIKAAIETNAIELPASFDVEYIHWAILIGVIGTTLASMTSNRASLQA